MKKLIIAAAIACAAAVSQASTVNWGLTGNVDAKMYASATAYLVCVNDLAKPSLTAETAGDWYKSNGSSLASKAFRSAAVVNGAVYETETINEAIGRKNYWLIIVADDEKNFAVSTTTKALNITTAALNATASWTAGTQMSTYAVPEPTSGLMLLLGIAGLALKRKRA